MKETVSIRKVEKKDCAAIIALRSELAEYQNIAEAKIPGLISEKDLERDGFDVDPPLFHCLVAEEKCLEKQNNIILGYAMYIIGYPVWEGKEIAIQDIFITKKSRGLGVGKLLLQELAKIALDGNYSRVSMDCPKLIPASEFCVKNCGIDMTLSEDWHILRFSKKDFHKLANTLK